MKRIAIYTLCMLLPLFSACEMKKDLFGSNNGDVLTYENVGLLDIEIEAER